MESTNTSMVNYLRKKMIQMAEEKGSLTHPDVVAISQRLDTLIVVIQQKMSLPQERSYSFHLQRPLVVGS